MSIISLVFTPDCSIFTSVFMAIVGTVDPTFVTSIHIYCSSLYWSESISDGKFGFSMFKNPPVKFFEQLGQPVEFDSIL